MLSVTEPFVTEAAIRIVVTLPVRSMAARRSEFSNPRYS